MGLGYRWNLDFAGPLNLTPQHNQYVLVMIEHFPNFLEFVSLLDHNNEGVTYAFLDRVFNRFGAPTKVFIDQGTKFHGEFQELREKTLIDHCTTSRNHPKADGLIERMVQMVKQGLQKHGLFKGHI
jgi:transposase-like protein